MCLSPFTREPGTPLLSLAASPPALSSHGPFFVFPRTLPCLPAPAPPSHPGPFGSTQGCLGALGSHMVSLDRDPLKENRVMAKQSRRLVLSEPDSRPPFSPEARHAQLLAAPQNQTAPAGWPFGFNTPPFPNKGHPRLPKSPRRGTLTYPGMRPSSPPQIPPDLPHLRGQPPGITCSSRPPPPPLRSRVAARWHAGPGAAPPRGGAGRSCLRGAARSGAGQGAVRGAVRCPPYGLRGSGAAMGSAGSGLG